MKFRVEFGVSLWRMWIVRRFICAVGCLLAVGVVCNAQQSGGVATPAQQASMAASAVSSPEIDALAGKLATQIIKNKLKSVVVVGVIGPSKHVTELGKELREILSDSLARQGGKFTVIDGEAIRAILHKNRIAEDMLYSDALGDWIALHMQADGIVTGHIDGVRDGSAVLTTELLRMSKYETNPRAELHSTILLTQSQIHAADRKYVPSAEEATAKYDNERARMEESTTKNSNGQAKMAACLSCPKPEYSSQARARGVRGTVYLLVIVQKDGTADNVLVTSPLGYGLDSMAVNSVLRWKFKPAIDPQGNPAASQVPIEIFFTLH
jgi:TonB family protein